MFDYNKDAETRYAELIQFMYQVVKTGASTARINETVMSTFASKINSAESILRTTAVNNKAAAFSHINFSLSNKIAFDQLSTMIKNVFTEKYLSQIVALISNLKGATPEQHGVIMGEVIGAFESHTPITILKEIIDEGKGETEQKPLLSKKVSTKKLAKTKGFLGSIAAGVGFGVLAGASRQRTLVGGALLLGSAVASTVKSAANRGLFSSSKSSGTDFTPREEKLEGDRSEGKAINLLERIEKNTSNSGLSGMGDKTSKGIKGLFSNILDGIQSKLGLGTNTSILSMGTAILGFLAKRIPIVLASAFTAKSVVDMFKKLNNPNATQQDLSSAKFETASRVAGGVVGGVLGTVAAPGVGTVVGAAAGQEAAGRGARWLMDSHIPGPSAGSSDKFSIAARSESGNDYGKINLDDGGSPAYGRLQLRDPKLLNKFIKETPGVSEHFNGMQVNSPEMQSKFKEVMKNKDVQQKYDTFINDEFYLQTAEKAKKYGFNINDKGIQQYVASIALQHSPQGQTKIFEDAAADVAKGTKPLAALGQARIRYYPKGANRSRSEYHAANRFTGEEVSTAPAEVAGPVTPKERISRRNQNGAGILKSIFGDSKKDGAVYMPQTATPNIKPEAAKPITTAAANNTVIAPVTNNNISQTRGQEMQSPRTDQSSVKRFQDTRMVYP